MSIFREFFVDIERSNASQTGGHTSLSHMFQVKIHPLDTF